MFCSSGLSDSFKQFLINQKEVWLVQPLFAPHSLWQLTIGTIITHVYHYCSESSIIILKSSSNSIFIKFSQHLPELALSPSHYVTWQYSSNQTVHILQRLLQYTSYRNFYDTTSQSLLNLLKSILIYTHSLSLSPELQGQQNKPLSVVIAGPVVLSSSEVGRRNKYNSAPFAVHLAPFFYL